MPVDVGLAVVVVVEVGVADAFWVAVTVGVAATGVFATGEAQAANSTAGTMTSRASRTT